MKNLIILTAFLLLTFIAPSKSDNEPLNVGIIIYDGVYLLDFAGPLEVFNDTYINDTTKGFNVFLISGGNEFITAHTGTGIKVDFTINNVPDIDILVVPGGNLDLAETDKRLAEFIQKIARESQIIMSVCTGAFILADLDLLDNLSVTTWYGAKEYLKKKHPMVIISNKRFTDNGKIITTAGVSAGIDGAFHVVERIYGKETSESTKKYIEWKE